MPSLFEPFTLKGVTLRNRIVAAPMCMYAARDGVVGEWHHAHLEQLATGGAGLVTVEMTDVSPEGRITWGDAGLWNDEQAARLAPTAAAIKAAGAVPAIQLGHAGRKASTNRPWEGDNQIADDEPHGWPVIGPSAIPFGSEKVWKTPQAMSLDDIARVQAAFAASAARARDAGFKWLELHFAHGFLAHSFLSPYSNRRDDRYGGEFENRSRFIRETFAGVRAVWPEHLPLSVRLAAIAEGVHRALVATFAVPEQDRFQIIEQRDPGEIVYDRSYLGIARSDGIVLIHIVASATRDIAAKRALYAALAENLSSIEGVRREDVQVVLSSNAREDWSFGNGIASYAPGDGR